MLGSILGMVGKDYEASLRFRMVIGSPFTTLIFSVSMVDRLGEEVIYPKHNPLLFQKLQLMEVGFSAEPDYLYTLSGKFIPLKKIEK